MNEPAYVTWDKSTGEMRGWTLMEAIGNQIPDSLLAHQNRSVGWNILQDETILVSTVFDWHFNRQGKQFHTVVFTGKFKEYDWSIDPKNQPEPPGLSVKEEVRFATYEEALAGHAATVKKYT